MIQLIVGLRRQNNFKSVFTLVVFMGFLSGCGGDDETGTPKPESNSLNKIMPLGASRVEGDRPEFESFRYELWKLLVDGGWDFDYIGTMTDEAPYPGVPDLPFDRDHEGRGGYTSVQILEGITGWLENAGTPDIVLFSSPGGNDALEGLPYDDTVENIHAIIEILQNTNPNVSIIIEQLAPGRSDIITADQTEFFTLMREEVVVIATENSTSTSSVIPVDMFTGFNDTLLADDVHYNEAGAQFIAERYSLVLEGVLRQ